MKLVERASETEMFVEDWGLEEWLIEQIKETNRVYKSSVQNQKLTYQPGPLRNSLIKELSFKSITEYEATKALLLLANVAPSYTDFEYLITQVFDEGRHSRLFREHLLRIGFGTPSGIYDEMTAELKGQLEGVIDPFKEFFNEWVITQGNYVAGILIITIILEGVLAPTSELSEIKWKPFDHIAARTQLRANIDELRHLTVCAHIVKTAIEKNPALKKEALNCITEGLALWHEISFSQLYVEREELYQLGIEQHKDLIVDYELVPGILLSETTVESRMAISNQLVDRMQQSRLKYMGLA